MDPTSTKERVLTAAARVFLEHGAQAASMDMVRQAAGVSNGSLYHHFPTKARLADALSAELLRGFHATLTPAFADGASARDAVQGMVRRYIDWVLSHPEGARLLHELRRGDALQATGAETAQANAESLGALRAWTERQAAAGAMRALPFPIWMAVVFAPVLSLTPQWVMHPGAEVPTATGDALAHAAWMAVAP